MHLEVDICIEVTPAPGGDKPFNIGIAAMNREKRGNSGVFFSTNDKTKRVSNSVLVAELFALAVFYVGYALFNTLQNGHVKKFEPHNLHRQSMT